MEKLLRSGGYLVIAIALFGALVSGLNTLVCLTDGLDVDNRGSLINIDRNPEFFSSPNPVVHALLFAPRWINQTSYKEKSYYGLGTNDQYLVFNQLIGLLVFLGLFLAIGALSYLSEQKGFVCSTGCLLLWLFIIYWAIPALWVIHQWVMGERLHIFL